MQQPLEDEYLKRKTTNPPKDPAKGSHENSEPPDNPARVTNGQNKKSLEAFITNNFEAFSSESSLADSNRRTMALQTAD